jgi:hypothetical protein
MRNLISSVGAAERPPYQIVNFVGLKACGLCHACNCVTVLTPKNRERKNASHMPGKYAPGDRLLRKMLAAGRGGPFRTRPPFPGAEQLIGCGRQQKNRPGSQGEAIERSLWRKIES